MLKAIRGGLMVLGLNKKEIEHLQGGNPLKFSLADVGAKGHVIIFMGKDDQEMKRKFERSGLSEPPRGLIDISKVNIQ